MHAKNTWARLCCMLSAVILQLKQQHEITEAEWNEKVRNNWLTIDGLLNISLDFAISRASKLEFIGVFQEINAYKVMVLSGTTRVIRDSLIMHAAQRYRKEKTNEDSPNQDNVNPRNTATAGQICLSCQLGRCLSDIRCVNHGLHFSFERLWPTQK